MEKRYETRSGDLFVRSWARVRRVSLDRRSSAGGGGGDVERITSSTNSLRDNIFIDSINDDIYSGLLINDLSDHLPILSIYIIYIYQTYQHGLRKV